MSGPAAILDGLPAAEARRLLSRCCGSGRWVEGMLERRPFGDDERLYAAAEEIWWQLAGDDWLEAFSHHPRIGDRCLEVERFAATRDLSRREQSGTAAASPEVLEALHEGNRAYEERFGHVFLICATGKSAGEMLAALEERLGNDPETELRVAAAEQAKILRLRLEKLIETE